MQKSIQHNSRTTNTFDNQIVKYQVRSALNIFLGKIPKNYWHSHSSESTPYERLTPGRPIRIPNEKSNSSFGPPWYLTYKALYKVGLGWAGPAHFYLVHGHNGQGIVGY